MNQYDIFPKNHNDCTQHTHKIYLRSSRAVIVFRLQELRCVLKLFEFNEASVVCHLPWSVEKLNEPNRIVQHICSEGAGYVE